MHTLVHFPLHFCCCWFIIFGGFFCSHCLWGLRVWSLFCYSVYWWAREGWFLCIYCLPDVLWQPVLCGISSQCQWLDCGVWLWHILIILTCRSKLNTNTYSIKGRCIYHLPNYDYIIMQLHQLSMVTVPASYTFCIKGLYFLELILSMIMKPVFTNLQVLITLAPILRCLTKVPWTLCMLETPKLGLWKK